MGASCEKAPSGVTAEPAKPKYARIAHHQRRAAGRWRITSWRCAWLHSRSIIIAPRCVSLCHLFMLPSKHDVSATYGLAHNHANVYGPHIAVLAAKPSSFIVEKPAILLRAIGSAACDACSVMRETSIERHRQSVAKEGRSNAYSAKLPCGANRHIARQ